LLDVFKLARYTPIPLADAVHHRARLMPPLYDPRGAALKNP
jgi:hypothetical protein